ncbi:hypothetical protein EPA93_46940 [Ktedonosporobacter rubrisoli]|uniref:Biotin-protein ligase N-terminal domain-containing protein n=1 Tax=Ktedonosporobacter rubrisoli TaxID=2509675 RepID=A0A4P6K580_KTERU|nr:BPL-N domain-containing protein [Ktedonosporobacter rubrisoli]QBD83103.1 hypothetical protein EPA93_46940 [Ktedonosporobacter rubrisoli]
MSQKRPLWQNKKLLYLLIPLALLLAALAPSGLTHFQKAHATNAAPAARPIALVYTDNHSVVGCDGCADAAVHMLKQSKWNFQIIQVGPDGQTLTPALLKSATLYVQPGGGNSVENAYAELQKYGKAHNYNFTTEMHSFVEHGGRYLGLCMGGFLAGNPGFNLLYPGDSGDFITSPGASVTTDADTIVDVSWRGQPRQIYFQGGAYFDMPDESKVNVLARYTNNEIAVMIAHDKQGKVAVSGPHPEATVDWYDAYHLPHPKNMDVDLANDLLDTLMQ